MGLSQAAPPTPPPGWPWGCPPPAELWSPQWKWLLWVAGLCHGRLRAGKPKLRLAGDSRTQQQDLKRCDFIQESEGAAGSQEQLGGQNVG